MGMTASAYLTQLKSLLPRGAAWTRDPQAVLTFTLQALADEFARVDGRAAVLLIESDPRTATELLADWERAFGLPDPCTNAADTIVERRNVLVEKITRVGRQDRQYFIDVAAALGFVITVTEFKPFTVNSEVVEPIYQEDVRYFWKVNAPLETITEFNVGSQCTDPLRDWGNEILECVISRLSPAHTHVIFAYGGA